MLLEQADCTDVEQMSANESKIGQFTFTCASRHVFLILLVGIKEEAHTNMPVPQSVFVP